MIVRFLMAFAALALGTSAVSAADNPYGTWRNPKNSLHVRVAPCSDRLCGTVVWASEKAKRDAAEGMDEPLIGSMIFRDLARDKRGVWRGRVFLPNKGRTFSGSLDMVDRNTMEAKGCVFGGLFCKAQLWTRLSD